MCLTPLFLRNISKSFDVNGGALSDTSSLTSPKDANRCLRRLMVFHPFGMDIDNKEMLLVILSVIHMDAFPWCSSPGQWMKRCSSRLVEQWLTCY